MKHASTQVMIGVLVASLSVTAHAAWESVYIVGKPFGAGYDGKTRNCTQDQAAGPAAVRNVPGATLNLGGGASRLDQSNMEYLEVYGQLIDTSTTVSISGVTPSSISIVDRINGVFNAAHFCGNIGSVVIGIGTPAVAQDTMATLNIGSEKIPVKVLSRNRVVAAEWPLRANTGSTGTGTTSSTTTTTTQLVTAGADPICRDSNNLPINCPTGSGTSSVAVLPQAGATGPAPIQSLGKCMKDHGGSASVSFALLTVVMPDVRAGIDSCFSLPAIAAVDMGTSVAAVTSSSITNPRISVSPTTPAGQTTVVSDTRAQFELGINPDQAGVELRLPAADYVGFTGRRVHTLTAAGASGTSRELRLAIQSVIPAGVSSIRPSGTGAGLVGRPSNTLRFDLALAQPAESGHRFSWQLSPGSSSVAPANCFAATSGTETPAVGATTIPVNVTITGSAASCDRKTFTFTAQPAGATAAIYKRSVDFSFLPLIQVTAPTTVTPAISTSITAP